MADQKLEKLVNEFAQAELNEDTEVLDKLLADDFVGIGPRGFLLTKEQWLARYRGGDLKNESFELAELQTRFYGDVAVVIGLETTKSTYQGNPTGGNFRATLIFIRQSGEWRLAGSQLSPTPDKPQG